MEKITSYEWLSAALVCFFACLARLGAEVNKHRESKDAKYRITLWKVVYNVSAAFLAGFLALNGLHGTGWGSGKKMLVLFLAAFLSPAALDGLMQVSGKMILREFAAWLSSKTGGISGANLSPENEPSADETDDSTPVQ